MENQLMKKWGGYLVAGIAGGLVTSMVLMTVYPSGAGHGSGSKLSVQEESATVDAVQKVLPSVVAVASTQNVRSFFGGVTQQTGGGSGFVISADGLIATNKHVVESTEAKYSVVTNDGKTYDATVVARDPLADLAVLKISASNLVPLELGDSDSLSLGQKVIAVGNALGQYQNTVTTGVVSGIGRVINAGDGFSSGERLEGIIQTDAAINPGNSGGPLLNISGQVVGINTAIDQQGQAIGFAIPINSIKTALASAIKNKEIVRPKLGLRYVVITKELAKANNMDITEGALVTRGNTPDELAVIPGGPADIAGIKEGDVLSEIDGKKITETTSLTTLLENHAPGDTISIKLIRQGKEMTLSVKLGKM